MQIIGVDYGMKRVGLAFSGGKIAFAGVTLTGGDEECVRGVVKEAEKKEAEEIVVGLPKNMNGTESEMTARAREFAEKLKLATKIKIVLWDERLTSAQADRAMLSGDLSRRKRKKHIDSISAQIMLQSYIDAVKLL